jgi:hypothetical protein
MLSAIDFDDEALRKADEIRDVEVDRNLPAKFVSKKAFRPKDLPKTLLGVRRLRAHLLGVVAQF